ncbi:FtsQ-type POTRA domain-containing protein [Microbacterium sp.]|uniref:FtsQ-type POTRA domain-containing protein n=1 Tax=Microbacterium sp. TaxID=51671 RepID=UPI0039E35B32
MRRPSPLPSEPPARPTPEPQAPPRAPDPVPDDPDHIETVPLGRPWHLRRTDTVEARSGTRAATAESAPAAAVEPAPDADTETVGVRAVWAAARARRRALRAEVRRFTARQRRRRRIWLGVAAALVLLVLGTVGAAYSPLFAVEKVRVVGATSLDADAVASALSGQVGTPLPLVDASAVKAKLVAFPLIESYTLEARPPHELVVRIVERTPIGSIATDAGYTLVDAAGVALSTTSDPPEGHPLLELSAGVGSKTFEAVGTVFRALPEDIRAQVTTITATTPNDVTLTLTTGTDVVWGDAQDSAMKAVVLATAMKARPPAEVSAYDVSSPHAVVVR